MDFSVIIVSYNVSALLAQALRSVIRASDGMNVEIWVVDNASKDDSVEMVRRDFPQVRLIANTDNPGFGRANNQAMRQAKGEYFLILNPDTIIQEDFLRVMKAFMDAHPECGASGGKILDPDGAFSPTCRRAFPRPSVAMWRILGLSHLFPKSKIFGQYNLTFLDENQITEVDALSGSCMVVRRDAILPTENDSNTNDIQPKAAGLFDESFFMYGEDLDWCYRIQQAGWKIFYTPETQILHYKGESTDKNDLRYVRLFYGAMVVFMEKHFSGQYARSFVQILKLGVHVRASIAAFGQKMKPIKNLLRSSPIEKPRKALFLGTDAEFEKLKNQSALTQLFTDILKTNASTLTTGRNQAFPDATFTDLIFSEASLSPSQIFHLMQDLNHLSVEFSILSSSFRTLIGEQNILCNTQ
jgi:GT2 family glycosyltransferase